MEYPEKEATLGWIELGVHVATRVTGVETSREAQLLVGLWIVAVAVTPVTWTLDPLVVQWVERRRNS